MRYPATHKDDTRARIVRAASRRFRRDGPDRTAIGDLMGDLRLTHGGFYRHFRGKDELFGEALAEALRDVSLRLERAALAAPEGGRAQAIIDAYLSPEHLGDVAGGCPIAALASDLSRAGRSLHGTAFEAAAREHMGRMANYLPGDTLDARRRTARVLFSGMAGTMAMGRALADPKRQREVLAEARQFYRTALGV
jgi:TetR/AcrR family transcriptional repressor of nem operon